MIKEFFGTAFLRTKYSAIESGKTTVSYEEQSGFEKPFRIMITQEGMWFMGTLEKKITSNQELQDFAKLISVCWGEHTKLAPKLSTSFKDL